MWRCAGGCDEIQQQDRPRSRGSVPLPRSLTHHHYLTHQTLIITALHIKPSSSLLPYTSNPHHQHYRTHQTLIISTALHINPHRQHRLTHQTLIVIITTLHINPHRHHRLTHQTLITTTLHIKPSSSPLPYTSTLIVITALHIKPSSSPLPYTSTPHHHHYLTHQTLATS